MKILEKVQKTIETDEIKDILCNKCGLSIKDENKINYHGLIEVESLHRYGSKYDGDIFIFSVCEKCLFKLMETFKIEPEKRDRLLLDY